MVNSSGHQRKCIIDTPWVLQNLHKLENPEIQFWPWPWKPTCYNSSSGCWVTWASETCQVGKSLDFQAETTHCSFWWQVGFLSPPPRAENLLLSSHTMNERLCINNSLPSTGEVSRASSHLHSISRHLQGYARVLAMAPANLMKKY